MKTRYTILRWLTAAAMGALIASWLVTAFVGVRIIVDVKEYDLWIMSQPGTVSFIFQDTPDLGIYAKVDWFPGEKWFHNPVMGITGLVVQVPPNVPKDCRYRVEGDVPFLVLVTLLLPLLLGCFWDFRFQIWHYAAYTALLASELAYYTA